MDNSRLHEVYLKASQMNMDTLRDAIEFQTKILGVYKDVFDLRKKYGEAPTPKPKKRKKTDDATPVNQGQNSVVNGMM